MSDMIHWISPLPQILTRQHEEEHDARIAIQEARDRIALKRLPDLYKALQKHHVSLL